VLTTQSGRQGIGLAASEDPDVILLDIVMPEMDGFEVCRAIKADERSADTPVVFLTAIKADKTSRVQALDAGGDAFLSKPIDSVELTAQIKAMFKIKAAERRQRDEHARLERLVHEQCALEFACGTCETLTIR
jgi:DNA-binding response OmpR family regulator